MRFKTFLLNNLKISLIAADSITCFQIQIILKHSNWVIGLEMKGLLSAYHNQLVWRRGKGLTCTCF